ncbi:MAG: hypothetical protein UT84_C0006G0009 [Candidatus Curtissbacteria bacterium GW2011_GWA1_40_16]|uniref:DNA 3'-5' helicase n=1 Tax=Candidatus Curtissbacteria bacterium GW2011_GWA1_40_16 TaxID=1618405 RepID=A0A0G0UKN4_9BACT|nr:MAG: hypothetical protein UT84_C0006G0009 [Candidatus Curtissbacteria bacterium GW2011_GWA1_40_16]
MIIAGAGTGKTTVIARRIAYIIEKKLAKPAEILALTFTDKAAGEMEERVDQLVPYGFTDTWISTFHAFGDRILRDNAFDLGISPDFKVLSKPQQVLFFQQNIFKFNLDYYRPLANPTKFISAVLSFFSRLKDENVSPEEFVQKIKNQKSKIKSKEDIEEIKKLQELANAYTTYEDLKTKAGLLDFGDQVTKTIGLFKKRPKILKGYQNHFKYIMVDEYQDTNFAQNELVKLLSSNHKNICVVGDDDQSIYKFRGAAISNIMRFKKDYKNAKQVVLTQNYRSTQAILDCSYRLIRHNDPDRLEVQNKIDKKLKSTKKEYGQTPKEIYADTLSQEADLVAAEIEKLTKKTQNSKLKTQNLLYRDIAILVRANSSADPFLRALNMRGIPHKFVGSSGLYQQEEVAVLISFLTAISNFEDSLNLYNLLVSDIYEMPPVDAIKLTSWANRKNKSLYYLLKNLDKITNDDLELSKDSEAVTKRVIEDLDEEINLSKKQNAGRVLFDFLKRTNYLKKLEKENTIEAQIKIQNIAKFFDKVREFTDIASAETVNQFINYLDALRGAGDDPATVEFDPDTDAVNVMTVHSAKGLEFPVVFLVNLISDKFPSRSRPEAIEVPKELIKEDLPQGDWHREEERRLFYVGATRAKDLLYFSWARDTGSFRIKKISPFVLEALDKVKAGGELVKLSPLEKIAQFEQSAPKTHTQTAFFDVDVLKLTQGSIDDYLTCAYKYRYIHILKIPILRHHAIVYGSALHAAVAEFLRAKKRGKIISQNQLFEIFENAWDSEGFLTVEHEEKRKEQGKLALSAFWKRESKTKDLPSLIESKFKFSLEGITVVGRYDRVDVKPGSKIEIIDYKSSENIDEERAKSQAKESTQLAIYALSYWRAYRILPEKLTLHFLETGIEGSYAPIQKDIEKTEKLITDTAQKINRDIKSNHFTANPKYFGREPACVYCAYKSICPFSLAK